MNLRLFYDSIRYSEDMDFDADPRIGDRLRRRIPSLIHSPGFQAPLRALGLRGVEMDTVPQKATATTLRFKMGLGNTCLPEPIGVVCGGCRWRKVLDHHWRKVSDDREAD